MHTKKDTFMGHMWLSHNKLRLSLCYFWLPPPIDITILHDIAFRENLSTSSISNYDCILSPFFIPHPSERNAINIQFSDKSTEDFPVICYTDGSKIDGRVGFAFVVFRSGVESENFQFRIRDECTVFVAELLFKFRR
ncbi:RNase H domain-containing protein [Trichonephila clavipes]|nr:RNase H domain-containing protein [Trichonephila clavipes]